MLVTAACGFDDRLFIITRKISGLLKPMWIIELSSAPIFASKSHTCEVPDAFTACGIQVSGSAIGAGYFSCGSSSLRNPWNSFFSKM